VFLDISQAFDKVWHQGLLLKIQQTLPPNYFNILQSYLQPRQSVVTYNNSTSQPVHMLSGAPQVSVLGPFLYTLYTADIPQSPYTVLSTYADDTAILSNHSNPITASTNLQTHLQSIEKWTRKWKIKINKEKSKHVTFSLRRETVHNSSLTRSTSPSGRSQIPGATSRQETYLELPHLNTTETPGPQDQRIILDHRKTLRTIAEQQTTNLQGNIETGMDLWNRAMGMRSCSPQNIV